MLTDRISDEELREMAEKTDFGHVFDQPDGAMDPGCKCACGAVRYRQDDEYRVIAKQGFCSLKIVDFVRQIRYRTEQRVRRETLERIIALVDDKAEEHVEPGWSHFVDFSQRLEDELRRAAASEPPDDPRAWGISGG